MASAFGFNDIIGIFIPQGFCIGKILNRDENVISIENPVLIISRGDQVMFAPILNMVKETVINIPIKDVSFNGDLFTPAIELVNQYNSIFGSGIVVSPSQVLKSR